MISGSGPRWMGVLGGWVQVCPSHVSENHTRVDGRDHGRDTVGDVSDSNSLSKRKPSVTGAWRTVRRVRQWLWWAAGLRGLRVDAVLGFDISSYIRNTSHLHSPSCPLAQRASQER